MKSYQVFSLLLMVALAVGDSDATSVAEGTIANVNATDVNGTILFYPSRIEDQLNHDITHGYYDHAFTLIQDFINRRRTALIKSSIDETVADRRTNVAVFAYKLWARGQKKVVEDYFPASFRMVFNDSLIKFTNNRFGLPIEFSSTIDRDGDTEVYGREEKANTNNYIWRLEPVITGNTMFFKIRHFSSTRYLKLGNKMDDDGDYQAYGSTDSDTERHHWVFQPVNHDGKLLFCIINRAHYQALKLANRAYSGSRKLYSAAGDFYNYPERYGWRIDVVADLTANS